MDGRLSLAYGTREGDLFVWRVRGDTSLNDSWWHYRHDERNTGLYGLDTRRPAAIVDLRRRRGRAITLSWTAPGDDYEVGTAARYDVRVSSKPITETSFWRASAAAGAPTPRPAGTPQTMRLTLGATGVFYVAIRAIDAAGNISDLGRVVRVGAG